MNRTGLIARGLAGSLLGALLMLAPHAARAQEQVAFSARDTGSGREFSYQLRNEYTGDVVPIRFTLRQADLKNMNEGLSPVADLQASALPKVIDKGNQRCAEIAERYNHRASCTVSATPSGSYEVRMRYLKGVDRAAVERDVKHMMSELQALQDKAVEDGSYSVNRGRDGVGVISFNYAAVAKRAVNPMAPAARAIKSAPMAISQTTNTLRIQLSRAIAFMQAIPYQRLGKQRSTGMGFLPPLAVISENRGDCDSKSVAFAAMVHTIAPDTPVAIILVPGHALVGLGIPVQKGDATLMSGGLTYVLAEPVGPAPARIGVIGPISQSGLKRSSDVQVLRVF